MKRRSLLLAGAAALTGAALAGGGAALAIRRYLRNEEARIDEAAGETFEEFADLVHTTIPSYDDGELHLIERGRADGRPLVFLHGVTLSSKIWHYQLRDLGDEFRVIALDQRGHGLSVAGTDGYGLAHLGRDLVTVLEKLDLHDATLIGHSMGGFAVMQFCTAHPDVLAERVSGIVLMNTAAEVMEPRPAWTAGVAKRFVNASARVPRPAQPLPAAVYLGSRYTFGKEPSATHVKFIGNLGSALPPEIFAPSVVGFLDMDLRPGLRSVRVRALVLAGSDDRLTRVRAARQIVANLAGAELIVFEGAGHTLMLERHAEVSRLIREFAGPKAVSEIDG
jgi:pimeloyl-ACP methyl ester carboxylesterase